MWRTPPSHQRAIAPSALTRGLDVWLAGDETGRAVLNAGMTHYLDRGATTFTLKATEAGFHL